MWHLGAAVSTQSVCLRNACYALCLCSYVCAFDTWCLGVAVSGNVVPILITVFVPVCRQYLGGCVSHGALSVSSLSAGVCHPMYVVSGCGCGFQNLLGVVSHLL